MILLWDFLQQNTKSIIYYIRLLINVLQIFLSQEWYFETFLSKKNYIKFCQAPIYHNWFPRTDIIRHSTGVVTTISLFYNCSQFVTGLLLSILFAIFISSFWGISIGTKKQKGTTPHGPFPFQHYVREKN